MFHFELWGLAVVVAVAVALLVQGARWGSDPKYGAISFVTILMVAGLASGVAGLGQDAPSCGRLDPRTGDGPDPEDVQACRDAQAAAEAALSPPLLATQLAGRAAAKDRATAAFLIVGGAGAAGVTIGLLRRGPSV